MPGGKMDKSERSLDEWVKETDFLEWSDGEYQCVIMRQHTGHLCGYVGISVLHNAYGKDVTFMEVHGGVTYLSFEFPSVNKLKSNQSCYWIGFDCAHASDYVPYSTISLSYDKQNLYKNIDYVKQEITNLIQQLDEYV